MVFGFFFGSGFASANSIEANENEKTREMLLTISAIGFFMMIAGVILLVIDCII